MYISSSKMFTVVTGRFNSETLISNYEYRRRHNLNVYIAVHQNYLQKFHTIH